MRIFDTHAHYDDAAFDGDRTELLTALHETGVERIVNMGAEIKGCEDTIALTKQYPFVYGALGIHPECISTMSEDIYQWLDAMLSTEKIVAVGEIGLDYHWHPEEKDLQDYWFRRQLALARGHGLPVAIHSREAAEDTFRILKEEHAEEIGGVIHAYSASAEMAKEYVEMSFFIGVGGVITFKNGKKLRRVVEEIPIEHIVIETDCPYLSPEPYRGRRNDSGRLQYVASEIATIKGMTVEEVGEITFKNGKRLYRMD
ncbi:MAG: TatD family deoxyribonuclease [Lachnospiraceae bacterium]|nr:TatD family deoxyribonuclease [Lachnospiraceae bacterium]